MSGSVDSTSGGSSYLDDQSHEQDDWASQATQSAEGVNTGDTGNSGAGSSDSQQGGISEGTAVTHSQSDASSSHQADRPINRPIDPADLETAASDYVGGPGENTGFLPWALGSQGAVGYLQAVQTGQLDQRPRSTTGNIVFVGDDPGHPGSTRNVDLGSNDPQASLANALSTSLNHLLDVSATFRNEVDAATNGGNNPLLVNLSSLRSSVGVPNGVEGAGGRDPRNTFYNQSTRTLTLPEIPIRQGAYADQPDPAAFRQYNTVGDVMGGLVGGIIRVAHQQDYLNVITNLNNGQFDNRAEGTPGQIATGATNAINDQAEAEAAAIVNTEYDHAVPDGAEPFEMPNGWADIDYGGVLNQFGMNARTAAQPTTNDYNNERDQSRALQSVEQTWSQAQAVVAGSTPGTPQYSQFQGISSNAQSQVAGLAAALGAWYAQYLLGNAGSSIDHPDLR